MNLTQSSRINVIFQYEEKKEQQLLDMAQLTALLGSDLIYIAEFKEPKKVDKKIWFRHVKGIDLVIHLK